MPGSFARAFVLVLCLLGVEYAGSLATGRADDAALVLAASLALAAAAGLAAAGLNLRLPRAWAVGLGAFPFVAHQAANLIHAAGPGPVLSIGIGSVVAASVVGVASFGLERRAVASASVAFASLFVSWLAGSALLAATPHTGTRPDVVLLVMDTTRRDAVAPFGGDPRTTPSLASLARSSDVYDDAWSTSPWTPPSHASMFTGMLPFEHRVDGEAQPPLPGDLWTFPQELRGSGWRTAAFPANPNLTGPGWDRGFDAFRPSWFVGRHSSLRVLHAFLPGSPHHAGWGSRSTPRVLALARLWWRLNADRPRFVFLNVLDPHRPYEVQPDFLPQRLDPAEIAEAEAIDQDPVSYVLNPGLDERRARLLRALYDAEVAAMDREVGKFLDWLRERGDFDRTLVIATSDHGERLGEGGLIGHDLIMDEHLLRVPLVVKNPGQTAIRRITRRVQLDGIAPYVLEVAGLEVDERLRSKSLGRQDRDVVVAEYGDPEWFLERVLSRRPGFDAERYSGNWRFLSDGRYGLLARLRLGGIEPRAFHAIHGTGLETSRLAANPSEPFAGLTTLAASLPAIRDRGEPSEPAAISEDDRERLRSLGYVN